MKQLTRKEYERTRWWRNTKAWIDNIPHELDSKKGAKPLKQWKVFEEETLIAAQDAARGAAWRAAWDAERDAAWSAAWRAARGAARDAAWRAAWDAAWCAAWRAAWDAASDAAWCAAWDAARDAASDAERDAAWSAARDASLLGSIKVCAGLDIDPKHVKYAEERWEANKRGYHVCCDVKGVLYVYRKSRKKIQRGNTGKAGKK